MALPIKSTFIVYRRTFVEHLSSSPFTSTSSFSLSVFKVCTKFSLIATALDGVQDLTVAPISPSIDYFNLQLEYDPLGQSTPSRGSSDSDSSLQQLSDDIEECVGCLIKLVPVFKDPAPQDLCKAIPSRTEANEDIDFARKMFPKANPLLLSRFGLANWRRRQALLSLKLRNDTNLSPQQRFGDDGQQKSNIMKSTNANITKPNDWAALSSTHHSISSPGSSYSGAASIDDSIFSRSDYFSSRSATSIAESEQGTRTWRFDVPKPPVKLKPGSIFDCPYCGQEIICGIQVNTNDDWTLHVFLDLEPYMCTFDDCPRADRTFRSREDWFQHELDHHRLRKIWLCQSCNHKFDEIEDIELHLNQKHKFSDDPSQLSLMVSLCEKYSGEGIPSEPCPLCGSLSATAQMLEDHIADHMEQLSLSSIQSVYGLEKGDGAGHLQELSSEKTAKLEFLNKFVNEQHGHFWRPPQHPLEDDSAGSNVAFAEDSDDEAIDQNIHFSSAEPAAADCSKRPPMNRRGDSWMKKINAFLGDQPADQPCEESWRSKVETFLDTKSVQSPQPQNEMHYCLRTRPPPRNKDFIGRDSEFARLNENLSQPGASFILSGESGIGKTDTAIEYTYRYEKDYSYIFWISAETAISCADTYSLIATETIVSQEDVEYEQDRLISLGREFLEQTEKRWLLVFDHVHSWSDIQQYFPTQPQKTSGSILITARTSDIADSIAMPETQFLELKALNFEESRLFLLQSIQPNLERNDMEIHPEYKPAGVIAKESEGHPLALSHIAGYVQVSECTLTDFIQLWNERRRHKTLAAPAVISSIVSTPKALETVWNIGLREVTTDARELLNILAFLDCDHIQRKLLVDKHEEASLDFLHSNQAFRSEVPIIICPDICN